MDLWSSAAAAAAAAAYSPRRVSVPVLVREGSAAGGYGGLTAKQEAALMAQAHLVGLGLPPGGGSPLAHFPFPPLHHFPHHLLMPPPQQLAAIPTSSSSSSHMPPSPSLLSAFGQNLKASGGNKIW
jgi:hypothetical protein